MPDLRNEPPETDHDRLIDMQARLAIVEREASGLRDWRHNIVAPVMMEAQAQNKRNADLIGRVAEAVERMTLANAALSALPGDFRTHRDEDRDEFALVNSGLAALHDKFDQNRAERNEAHKKLIYWISGLLIAGLAAIVGTQWALIAPHVAWH